MTSSLRVAWAAYTRPFPVERVCRRAGKFCTDLHACRHTPGQCFFHFVHDPRFNPASLLLNQADGGALLENVRERGEQLRAGLEKLKQKYPQTIAGEPLLAPCLSLPWRKKPSFLLFPHVLTDARGGKNRF